MTHYCKLCDYNTNEKFNFIRHLKSKRHVEKITKAELCNFQNKCIYCNNIYSNASNLSKHQKLCDDKNLFELLNTKIISLENKINNKDGHKEELLELELQNKTDHILSLTSEINNLRSIINSNKTSLSAYNYINSNYINAPPLEAVTNVVALHYEMSSNEFVEHIISLYKKNALVQFIGDFIVENYKKEDPNNQSLWNSDTSRLTYIIRTLLKNQKCLWMVDKKGIDTTNYLITPILKYIEEQLSKYISECDVSNRQLSTTELLIINDKISTAYNLLQSINSTGTSESILRHIAPNLYLIKQNLIS